MAIKLESEADTRGKEPLLSASINTLTRIVARTSNSIFAPLCPTYLGV